MSRLEGFHCRWGGRRTNLSKNEVPYLVVDESALGKIDEPVAMEIGVPIVQECEVRHVKSPVDRDYIIQSISLTPFVPSYIH